MPIDLIAVRPYLSKIDFLTLLSGKNMKSLDQFGQSPESKHRNYDKAMHKKQGFVLFMPTLTEK
jgi:hypothetical protein